MLLKVQYSSLTTCQHRLTSYLPLMPDLPGLSYPQDITNSFVKSTVDFLINSSFFHLHPPAITPQVERQKMEANINLPTREYSFLTIQTISSMSHSHCQLCNSLYVSRIVMNKRGNYWVSVTAICCFLKIVYHFSVFTLTACCSLLFWK